jgi:lysophospholipase L1-like esterase
LSGRREPTPRPVLGALALAGPAALFALDTGLALARRWRPRTFDGHVVLALGAAVAVAAVLVLLTREGARFVSRNGARLLLALLATLAGCAAAEAVLAIRADWVRRRDYHHRAPHLRIELNPDPTALRGLAARAHFTTNSRGVRGPECPPGAYRILAVGGSTTEGYFFDDDVVWTGRLRILLGEGTWVGNVGMSGYQSRNHLTFVQEGPLAGEADVLLFLIGVNDLQSDLETALPPPPPLPAPLWTKLRLTGGLFELVDGKPVERPVDAIWIEDPTGSVYNARRCRRAGPFLDRIPDLDRKVAAYRERVAALVAAARARGARPVFVTQPVLWKRDLSEDERSLLWFGWLREGDRVAYLTPECLRDAMDRYNAALLAETASLGAECIDVSDMCGVERFFTDDCHYTIEGSLALADRLAQWFRAHPAGERPRR